MSSPNAIRVAVIGVGAAGLATALTLTDRSPDTLDLTLFDPSFRDPELSARGLAYTEDHIEPLLNAPATMMSIRVEDASDFSRWVRHSSIHPGPYVPRSVFGDYLAECFEMLKRRWVGRAGTLHCVPSRVISVTRNERDLYSLSTETARFDQFDVVFLCVGWGCQDETVGDGVPAYPLADTILHAMAASHVGVIGTGLTAIDVARGLLSHGYRGRITIASRRGVLPGPRVTEPIAPVVLTRALLAQMKSLDLRQLLQLVEREAQEHGISLEVPIRLLRHETSPEGSLRTGGGAEDRWRALLVSLCDEAMADAWHLLDNLSRRVFRRWLHPYFQAWCNPMPPTTAAMIEHAWESGQIQVRSRFRRVDDGALVFDNAEREEVDFLISARLGADESVADMNSPLMRSLIEGGLAMCDDFGGLRVNYGSWQVVGASGARVSLYAIGSLAQGARYYVNALDSILRTIPEAVDDALRRHDAAVQSMSPPARSSDGR
ncbi:MULTISPECIES: FAD/NAD(P)-binding protein [unclassified Microbacterium]|uniref:FAD/NAD(P)-binding protein n=1 Tax=unclassified Microbacterium TaxID=2609290 RepID=UPI001605209B|nr:MULTISPECIES: FAD/NAD(P)-binding protein [unclassified Microbacterium]QNA91366.1 hypothetical protein G4G29_00940 [Microbacterium sp. Se63.02b]QYM64525.1 FAD/NAD(P)-binding protein [Microbacterium sp. Se5.02b]